MTFTASQREALEIVIAGFERAIEHQEQARKMGHKDAMEEELSNDLKDFMEKCFMRWTECPHCGAMNKELNNGSCSRCGKFNGKREEKERDNLDPRLEARQ